MVTDAKTRPLVQPSRGSSRVWGASQQASGGGEEQQAVQPQAQAAEREAAAEGLACVHHWRIGSESKGQGVFGGICKKCGELRDFHGEAMIATAPASTPSRTQLRAAKEEMNERMRDAMSAISQSRFDRDWHAPLESL